MGNKAVWKKILLKSKGSNKILISKEKVFIGMIRQQIVPD